MFAQSNISPFIAAFRKILPFNAAIRKILPFIAIIITHSRLSTIKYLLLNQHSHYSS